MQTHNKEFIITNNIYKAKYKIFKQKQNWTFKYKNYKN